MSYLPLAHIYERVNHLQFIYRGIGIGKSLSCASCCLSRLPDWTCPHYYVCAGFYSGDVLRLVEDIQLLRPTLFFSVPRLLNRIYDKVGNPGRKGGGQERGVHTCLMRPLAGQPLR